VSILCVPKRHMHTSKGGGYMSSRMKIIPFAAIVASLFILPQAGHATANFDGLIEANFQIGIEPGQASVDNNTALAWVTYYSGNAQNLIDQENTGQSPTAYVMTPDGHASAEVSGVFEGTSGQPSSPFYLTLRLRRMDRPVAALERRRRHWAVL